MVVKLLFIGAGGFMGAVSRYLVGGWAQRAAEGSLFPYGTATVNVLGCLAIGFVAGLTELRGVFSPDTRAFLLIGMLGGFTTFSTFGFETYELMRTGQSVAAASNVLLNVVLGIAAVVAGQAAARLM